MHALPVKRPDPAPLAVRLLGTPAWQLGDGPPVPLSRHDAALLALLILDGEQPRDRLAAWLWPDVPQKNANLNLRQRLFRLRRQTGHAVAEAGAVLRVAAGVVGDVDAGADWPDVGELLGGQDYGDSDALDTWVQAARQRCEARRLDQLAGLAARQEAQGALAAAISTCNRLLARAPLLEHGWRRLMRLHFLRGDRASAIDAFERFEQQVREQMGSRPSAETIELLRDIERMDADPATVPGPLPPSLRRPPQLVGRQPALAALGRAWQSGHAALVIGPAGVGKSRLLADFVHGRPGVLGVRGQPGDGAMPYALVSRLLRRLIDRFAPALDDPHRAELSRLLPELGRAPTGVGQQQLLWQAATAALDGAIVHGLQALVVDDLQVADEASLELLRWWLADASLTRLHVLLAARPEDPGVPPAPWRAWLADSARLEPVPLAAWTEDDVAVLLRSLALPGLSASTLAPALHRHAGGHPLFTLETLKRMLLDGSASGGAALPQPATVQAMVERRFAGLSAPALALMRLAAVAGHDLPPAWAARVQGCPLMDLTDPWRELEAAQIFHGPGFAHDLVRQAALDAVPQPLQAALHRALAETAEDGTPPARVAEHWLAAGDGLAATPWLRAAARAARLTGRLAEQQTLLERAASACRDAGDLEGALDAECDALAGITIRLGSATVLERIAALQSSAAGLPAQQARLEVARSEALCNLARYAASLQAADRALALAAPDSAAHADALGLQCRTLAMTGDTDTALARLAEALPDASATMGAARELEIRAALAHALAAAGRVQEALAQQALARVLARETGDAAEVAQATGNLATLSFVTGDTPAAWRLAQDAAQRYAAMDSADAGHGVFNRIVLGRSAAHLGHLGESLTLLEATAAVPARQVGSTTATLARSALAWTWLWLGQPARARAALGAAEPDGHAIACMGWWLACARACESERQDAGAARASVERLVGDHPELLDEPQLLLEWARHVAPDRALPQLRRAAARFRRQGRVPVARSIALGMLALRPDARAAGRLTAEMPSGLFAGSYPPEAWWTLARAQRGAARAACIDQALRWLREQALPGLAPQWHRDFLVGNPVNRALWTAAGLPLPAPVTRE